MPLGAGSGSSHLEVDFSNILPAHINQTDHSVLFVANLAEGSGQATRGEFQNLTDGGFYPFDYSSWYAALVWVPLVSGTNELRAAVFDQHGNEYPLWVTIRDVP